MTDKNTCGKNKNHEYTQKKLYLDTLKKFILRIMAPVLPSCLFVLLFLYLLLCTILKALAN